MQMQRQRHWLLMKSKRRMTYMGFHCTEMKKEKLGMLFTPSVSENYNTCHTILNHPQNSRFDLLSTFCMGCVERAW